MRREVRLEWLEFWGRDGGDNGGRGIGGIVIDLGGRL